MERRRKNKTTLLHLNDDCLYSIFEYLDKLDRIRFALTCCRVRDVMTWYCKWDHTNVTIDQHLSILGKHGFRQYFQAFGSIMKTITIQTKYEDVHNLIKRHCTNVEKIIWLKTSVKFANVIQLTTLASLHSLHFEESGFRDDLILVIAKIPTIKELSIKSSWNATGKFFRILKNLQKISLENCTRINYAYLSDLWKSMKELRVLELKNCGYASTEMFNKYRPKFTKLALTYQHIDVNYAHRNNVNIEAMLEHPNFTDNAAAGVTEYSKQLLIALPQYGVNVLDFNGLNQFVSLNDLVITGYVQIFSYYIRLTHLKKIAIKSCTISHQDIIFLLQNCPKLWDIYVENNAGQINESWLSATIKEFSDQELRKKPVRLFLNNGNGC